MGFRAVEADLHEAGDQFDREQAVGHAPLGGGIGLWVDFHAALVEVLDGVLIAREAVEALEERPAALHGTPEPTAGDAAVLDQ